MFCIVWKEEGDVLYNMSYDFQVWHGQVDTPQLFSWDKTKHPLDFSSMSWLWFTPQGLLFQEEHVPGFLECLDLYFGCPPSPPLSPHTPGVSDGPRFVSDGPWKS